MLIYFLLSLISIYIYQINFNNINNQNWQATNYQKERLIADTKKFIKQKLDELQR